MIKRNKLSFLIIFLLIALVGLTLPSYSSIKAKNNSSNNTILDFDHPEVPISPNDKIRNITTSNYILVDVATNKIIAGQNENGRIYPASTTKLATALTALNIYPLDEVITVKELYTEGKVMELQVGEKISIRSLIDALLVYSANDSAYNLSNYHLDGSVGFIAKMNDLMKTYGLKNTNFTNFDGIHNENHYSTVYDLSQLGRISIKNPIIREVVKKEKLTVTDITGQIRHDLVSTNELLDKVPEIEGLKTGWTPEANGSFIGLFNIRGHELISVVASSTDRFADTTKIIDWAKSNITWTKYQP